MRLPKSANSLAAVLAAYLETEGLNAHQAAERLDIRHQRLYTWTLGQNLPPRRQAEDLAKRLNCPGLVDLVDRERKRRRRAKQRALVAAGGAE